MTPEIALFCVLGAPVLQALLVMLVPKPPGLLASNSGPPDHRPRDRLTPGSSSAA